MDSPQRTAVLAFAAALVAGLVVVAIAASTRESRVVQTLGVTPVYPVAPIAAGQEACQDDVGLAERVERVRFNVGTFGEPGPPLEVRIRSHGGGRIGRAGRVAAGWADDGSAKEVEVGPVREGQIVSVCVRNLGPVRAYVYGDLFSGSIRDAVVGVRPTVSPSSATIDRVPIEGDLSLNFMATEPRGLLTRVPDMLERAARFRPGFVGAWTYWVLLAAALVGAPLLVARAASSAAPEEEDRSTPRA